MNRFPKHYHEGGEKVLRCSVCNHSLTENEEDVYWHRHPYGQGDPCCSDCQSHLDADEFVVERKQPSRFVSRVLFTAAFLGFVMTPITHQEPGKLLMCAIGLLSAAIMARIFGW